MIYQGKVQRWLLAAMLMAVNLPPLLHGTFPIGFGLYFQLFVSVFILMALFIKARVRIRKDNIIYRVELWGLPLYYKTVYADDIRRIDFNRSNRGAKSALIHVQKGINLRFALFPDNLFGELMEFTERNNIGMRKSKGYQRAEKLDSNRLR